MDLCILYLLILGLTETFDFLLQFCRTFSSANFQSSDVRPLPTLKRTLQYLLHLLDDSEFSFDIVYDFLFDRTRAIRQELDMQRIANSQAINMYEQIVCQCFSTLLSFAKDFFLLLCM